MGDDGDAASLVDPAHGVTQAGPDVGHVAGLAFGQVAAEDLGHVAAVAGVDQKRAKWVREISSGLPT